MSIPRVAPLFIENETFSTTVHLVNETQYGGWINLSLFDLDGNKVASFPEYFEPVSDRSFQVKELLSNSGLSVPAGSVHLTPINSGKAIQVLGQLSITHYQAGTYAYLDEEFAMPQFGASNVLRAVAEGSPRLTVIAVSNTINKPLTTTVTCMADSANRKTQAIVLKPYETRLLRPCSATSQQSPAQYLSDLEVVSPSEAGNDSPLQNVEALGISVQTSGPPGDLVAYGLVSRSAQRGLDLGSVEFIDPAPLRSSGLVFSGVPVGYTSLLNKTYNDRIGIVNFTSTPAHVSVIFAKSDSQDTSTDTISQLTLAANSSKLVKLAGLHGDPNMLNSFIVRSDAVPGGVLSKFVAQTEDSAYRAEAPAKDEDQRNNSGGHPWSLANGIKSTLFLFNHDSKPQTVTVRIGTKTGDWRKAYAIRSMETVSIDVDFLIQQGVKDDEGKELPTGMINGEIGWIAPEPHLAGRLLQSDNTTGMARNFSCAQSQILCGVGFNTPNSLALVDGQQLDLGIIFGDVCVITGPNPGTCRGGQQTAQITSGVTNSFSSNNSAVTSFISSTPAPSTSAWKGVAAGATTAKGTMSSTTLGSCFGTAPVSDLVPSSLTGTAGTLVTYSNQTVNDCNGNLIGNNKYGVSECYSWQINDQTGEALEDSLAVTETLTVEATNVGAKTYSGNITSNNAGQFKDFLSNLGSAALPANACTYYLQAINVAGANLSPLQYNCIHYTATGISDTKITAVSQCQTPAISCP